jgi:hypothetical protein
MPNNPDTAAQVARLREMAEEIRDSEARCLRFAAEADEDGNERSAGAYRLTASIQTNRLTALSAAADAMEREAGLVADSERLTWMINESNSAGGWIADHVWDDATKLCAVDYDEADDVQKWVRAAIDAMRGPQ